MTDSEIPEIIHSSNDYITSPPHVKSDPVRIGLKHKKDFIFFYLWDITRDSCSTLSGVFPGQLQCLSK